MTPRGGGGAEWGGSGPLGARRWDREWSRLTLLPCHALGSCSASTLLQTHTQLSPCAQLNGLERWAVTRSDQKYHQFFAVRLPPPLGGPRMLAPAPPPPAPPPPHFFPFVLGGTGPHAPRRLDGAVSLGRRLACASRTVLHAAVRRGLRPACSGSHCLPVARPVQRCHCCLRRRSHAARCVPYVVFVAVRAAVIPSAPLSLFY